jgi:hypothetical protein
MRSIVATRFLDFTETFEGYVEYMYVDVKGLVTIGFGNLIDPISYALALPFVKKPDGTTSATQAEITAEWHKIKDAAILDYTALADLTTLKLTREAIVDLCRQRLRANEAVLKRTREFQTFDEWPADAQLALHSMAWAMGPAFAEGGQWPRFRAACGQMDFAAAAANCRIDETGNPGVVPRNFANKTLFGNAPFVLAAEGRDDFGIAAGGPGVFSRDVLYYPANLVFYWRHNFYKPRSLRSAAEADLTPR